MRSAIFSKASVLLAIGGGPKTKEEIMIAERQGMPVIPVGMSGGIAYKVWLEYHISKELNDQDLFLKLNSKNPFIASGAIIERLKSLIILSD